MLAALYTLTAAELWPIPEAAGSPQQKAAVDEYMKFFGHLGGGGAPFGNPMAFGAYGAPQQPFAQPWAQPQPPGPQQPWGMMGWPSLQPQMPAVPPKPKSEVPVPRVFVAGVGMMDMPMPPTPAAPRSPAAPSVEESALDKETSSYNATEVLGDRRAEIARLRAQIRLSFDKELRFMQWYGLADGARVVEFGCGPGWSTAKFAAALPSSDVTCVEIDAGFVAAAKEQLGALAQPGGRVHVLHGSATHSGLPAGSADFVTARFVLQHLRQPSLVLAEAYRILAPGGRVAFVETDDMIGARRAIRIRRNSAAQFGRAIL